MNEWPQTIKEHSHGCCLFSSTSRERFMTTTPYLLKTSYSAFLLCLTLPHWAFLKLGFKLDQCLTGFTGRITSNLDNERRWHRRENWEKSRSRQKNRVWTNELRWEHEGRHHGPERNVSAHEEGQEKRLGGRVWLDKWRSSIPSYVNGDLFHRE